MKNMKTVEDMHNDADRRVGSVFRTMLIFTSMMVMGPISTYFFAKNYIEENWSVSKDYVYIYSVAAAVIVIHIILGAFIYIAWKDANAEAAERKRK